MLASDIHQITGHDHIPVHVVPHEIIHTSACLTLCQQSPLLIQGVKQKQEMVFQEGEYLQDLKELIEKKREYISAHPENSKSDFSELIGAIGVLKDTHNFPPERRKTLLETRDVIQCINENEGELRFGTNTYLVPGSLSSIHRLMKNEVLTARDISLITGDGVSMQEGIRFVKLEKNGHGLAQKHFIQGKEILERLHLNIGHHSSLAHETAFIAKTLSDGVYELEVNITEDSFIGINASIGSGANIGARTTVWWNSKIGFDTIIGDDVTMGMSSEIEDGIKIPPNCLVPNRALITKDFKLIPFGEYRENEIMYDTTLQSAPGRRNFVIELGSRTDGEIGESSYDRRLRWINPDYFVMSQFNKTVTKENKEFAVIDSFLSLIHDRYPELGILREVSITPPYSREEIYTRCKGKLSYELIDLTFQKGSSVTYKAYPKDKKAFILEGIPTIIDSMQRGEDITPIIGNLFVFPQISGDENKIFFGRNIIIGNCHLGEDSFIYDSRIRLDEFGPEDTCNIQNSALIKNTIHGSGSKHIKNAHLTHSVIHGEQDINSADLGEMGYPSTYNNTVLHNCTALGGITCNNVKIQDSKLGFGTTISATADNPTILKNVQTGEGVFIGRGNNLNHVEIYNNMIIGSGISLSNTVMTPQGLYDKKPS